MADASLDATDGIPGRIFQTWKIKELPSNYAFWRNTLVEKNGRFEFELWDDQDNRKFIEESAAWFLPTYDSYPAEIYRVDVVRYFYLYFKGGFYIDLDTECLGPLSKFLQHPGVLLGRMGPNPEFNHSIPNAIMASRAKEEFWLLVMALAMERSSKQERPEALTGSILLKNAVDLYLSGDKARISSYISKCSGLMRKAQAPRPQTSTIFILSPREWYPIDWSDPIHLMLRERVIGGQLLEEPEKAWLFPASTLVTYWTHSWEDLKKTREQFLQSRLSG